MTETTATTATTATIGTTSHCSHCNGRESETTAATTAGWRSLTIPSGKLGYMDMDTEEWIVVLIGVGIVVLVFALVAGLM